MNLARPPRELFPGTSEAHTLVHQADWASSSLGPVESWPQPLVSTLQLVLSTKYPMFLAWGDDHVFLYNDAYAALIAEKHPQAFGKDMPVVWEEVWEGIHPLIKRALAGESVYFENYPLTIQRQGKVAPAWFTFSYSPVYSCNGRPGGVFGVCTETTELILAQKRQSFQLLLADELRELHDPLEVTTKAVSLLGQHLGASRVTIADVDPKTGFARGVANYTDGTLSPLVGPHHPDEFGPGIFENLMRGETRIFADISAESRLGCLATKELFERVGGHGWITVPVVRQGMLRTLLIVNQQEPRDWAAYEVSLVEDVAERIWSAVERAVAEKEVRLLNQSLQVRVEEEAMERDRLWRMTEDLLAVGSTKGYFVSCNPALTATLGYPEDELTSLPFQQLVHEDDLEELEKVLARLSNGQMVHRYKVRARKKDGDYRWLSWTGVPQDDKLYLVGRDITAEMEQADALQRSEEALRQAQKMDAIGQLTGGLAHDFNNLLAGVVGHVEVLQLRAKREQYEDFPRYLDTIKSITDRATALTHRLLAFSRRQTLDPVATNVNELVSSLGELIRQTIGPSIHLHQKLGENVWNTFCDAHQLENSLLNLVINARDALPHGGNLYIETRNVTLSKKDSLVKEGAVPGDYLLITVRDDGTGMPPEVLARAFDPFFTTKPIGQGTGLGLSMVFGFVKQSGGHIRITSEVGRGTTVRLKLPRYSGTALFPVATAPKSESTLAPSKATILVVDDEAPLRGLLVETLLELGYNVLQAADGAEGLSLLQKNAHIDLLVSDVGLPGNMNGRQMADAARVSRPDLKVLFITGYAEKAALKDGQLESHMQVMTKPFTLDAFTRRLHAMLLSEEAPQI